MTIVSFNVCLLRRSLVTHRGLGLLVKSGGSRRLYGATKRPRGRNATHREKLLASYGDLYPQLLANRPHDGVSMRFVDFYQAYNDSIVENDRLEKALVTIRGRVRAYRDVSSKLVFYDLVQDGRKIQIVCNHRIIGGDAEEFYQKNTAIRIGDIISITGNPGRTQSGQLSLYALEHFRILAPCLHQIPDEVDDLEKRLQHRHVDLLVNPTSSQTLRLRSKILQVVRSHFTSKGFIEVQTPIISPSAGGAVARPFLTEASSVARGRKLALRIAPELWLKRLVVGGLDRVFEMGPQFRNEGIDATHNPEFTTCEAYMAYGRLDDAIALIEQLFQHCDRLARQLKCPDGLCPNLDPMDPDIQKAINLSFRKLDFIPALEEAMKCPLPDVDRVDRDAVVADLVDLCDRVGVLLEHSLESRTGDNQPRLPQTPAKILDRLATHFLEPQCFLPTFIINHPECMSPLAKSRTNAAGRRISMRCELFVMGREIVNAYEEENSPFQQRVKFRAQMEEAGEDGEGDAQAEIGGRVMDESYCKALEWGLPPTTGLGIGVDRLVMLFSGQERMTDVLSFGGIRGAINQGAAGSAMSSGKKDSKEWELAAAKTNDLELTEDGKFLEVDQALRAVEGVGDMVSELVESMKDRGPGPGPNSESSLSSSS